MSARPSCPECNADIPSLPFEIPVRASMNGGPTFYVDDSVLEFSHDESTLSLTIPEPEAYRLGYEAGHVAARLELAKRWTTR